VPTTYLDVAGLRELLSHDGVHTGTAASLDPTTLEDHILVAEQQVDAKLAVAGYDVPLFMLDGNVPPLIVGLTGAVAAYHADLQYRRGKPHEGDLTPIIQRYRWATGILAQIGTRLLIVPGVEQDPAKRGQGGEAVEAIESYEGRMFTPEIADVGPYRTDPDWWY
jgi:hypothetical protein